MTPQASSARSFTSKIQQLRNLRRTLAALCATAALVTGILYAPAGKAAVNQMLHRAWPSMRATKAAPAPRAAKTAKAAATRNLAAAPAGNLNIARQGHAAMRLSDGKILVVGGENANGLIRESEIFNPATHSFITAASLDTARTEHTLTRLADGRILVIGGRGQAQPLRTTEIYNYSGNVFTPGPALNRPRAGHTATTLADGRILIAGGSADGSAEIYNPATQSFTVVTGRLDTARSFHGAALLNTGKVLLAGGKLTNGSALNSAELFNPATQTFAAIAKPMRGARVNPVLNKLRDGKIQVIGGGEATMEMFNAGGEYFTAYAHLPNNAVTMKTPGRAALFYRKNRRSAAETGDTTGNLNALVAAPDSSDPTDRDGYTMTDSGSTALIAGGTDSNGATLNSAEETPASAAAVTTDKTDYAPGEVATITGTGFLPNQSVSLLLERDPPTPATTTWTAQADATGNFTTAYNVVETDLNVSFILTASGQPDNYPVAQTTFTDGAVSGATVTIKNATCTTNQNTFNVSDTVCSSAVVTVGGSGNGDFRYQWYNSTTISTATLVRDTAQSGLTGTYTDTYSPTTAGTWTVMICKTANAGACTSPGNQSGSATFIVNGAAPTTLTVSSATGTYGGTINLSATLKKTSDNSAVSGKTITFTLNGNSFAGNTATTNASGVATLSNVSLSGINASTYNTGVGASFASDSSFGASSGSNTLTVNKATPTITWNNPADITYGTALSATQLNATASVAGTFNYSPASGAVLSASNGQTLSVSFTPTDTANYNTASASATINVLKKTLTPTVTVNNKVYDRTTTATIATRSLAGIVGSDDVALTGGTATFDTKNVGTGKTVTVAGLTLSGATASNYQLSSTTVATTANITALALTGTITANSKVYDGNATATILTRALSGVIAPDVVNYTGGTASFADKNAGTGKTVTATGLTLSGADAGNYTVNGTATTTADITARALTVSATGVNKVYDGAVTATVTLSDDRVAGDALTTSYTSASFANKHVGTGKTVSVSGIALSGADAGNYTFNTTATTTANITALAITVTAVASTKSYDGTTSSSGLPSIAPALVGGDTSGFTQSYDTKHVGTGKTLTPSGSVSDGNSGNNYNVTFVNNTSGVITARAITVTAATNTKSYDGTTSAAATPTITGGSLAAGDTASFSESYNTRHVGTGKTLTPSGTVNDGNGGNNYAVTFANDMTGVISARAITVTAASDSKVYDGTAVSGGTPTITAGSLASGDTATFTQAFDSKNAGPRTLTPSGAVSDGNGGGNYAVTYATASGSISTRALAVTATGVNRVYDGTTAASVILSDNRIGSDLFTASYASATFADKNVGTGKPVSVSGISISGTDTGNYTFNTTAATTANITPRALTVSASGVNKVYNGNTTATVNLSDDHVSGDNITTSYTSATFNNKSVGTAKPVSVTGIAIGGTDVGNYTFNTTAATTADITARALTVSATGINKIYDGNISATVNLSDDHVSGDNLTTSYASATFNNKNVGTAKPVSVTGITLGGTDAGNYTFNTTAATTANITAKPITVNAVADSKVYDGTTTSGGTPTITPGLASGDTPGFTQAFDSKNVGPRTLNASGAVSDGYSGNNYTLTFVPASGSISARALTVSASGVNKVYDGNTTATVTLADNRVSGDVFTDSYTSAAFADKNVGTGKPVSVSGISISGMDAGNYTFNSTAATTANITARGLTVTATASNKVYDGNTTASVALADNRVSGDTFTINIGSATFDTKNVGIGKTVTVSGITLSGADAGNYSANTSTTTTANITPLALTGSITADNKVYDGTTAATIATRTLSGVVGSDAVSYVGGTATFADKHAGNGKTVTATGLSLSGGDAGNYTVNSTAATTANITKRGLTITALTNTKIYDGTISAAAIPTYSGLQTGDSVTGLSETYDTKHVGTGKTLSVASYSISDGNGGNNYAVSTQTNTTGAITRAGLTITAIANTKVYDGTTSAAATPTVSGLQTGDSVSGASESYDNRNAGTGKTLSVVGYTVNDGNSGGNYTIATVPNTNGVITALALTGSVTAANKVYDGNVSATILTRTLTGVLGSDSVSYTGGTATFASKTVATGKVVTATGLSLSGTDAGNYSVNTTATTTADITALAITGSITADNKVYDGTTAATIATRTLAGVVIGDSVSYIGGTATFNNKNVGTGKTVTATGLSLSGTDAGNYTVNTTATTTATITARALMVTATASNKYYDGATTASVTLADNRVSGDVLTISIAAANFDNANVGTGKTVTVTGIAISGTDAGNYAVNTTTTTTANILARPTVIHYTGALTSTYGNCTVAISATLKDGLTNALVTQQETITISIAGQTPVTLTSSTGVFTGTATITSALNVGSYNIVSTFNGNTNPGQGYAASSETLSGASGFQITPAFVGPYNGGAIYTGLNFFWTTGPSSSTATLTLSATLKDITTPCQGDIRTARVTFATRNADGSYSPISNAQNLPVGLVNPADLTVGTAQAVSQYNLGNQNFASIQIAVIITGNYKRDQSADDTIVGIAKPGVANQMIGVGKLNNLAGPFASNGFLGNAPATGANYYTSIASNVSYNKSFTNPQGKVNIIVKSLNRSNGTVGTAVHTYSITSNSITTFTSAVVNGQQVVTFGAKCNVVEITNPATPIALEGGAQMQIVMSPPAGSSGQTASITVQKNGGGMWYSSAWDGTKTVAKPLSSGMISVN
ncbi:MAG: hypothetical protein HYR56_07835 [Acidobacteria bacterium]|nr:hypothetical protein [Acidobacteriota bacterium]